jgi:hypothetical protein
MTGNGTNPVLAAAMTYIARPYELKLVPLHGVRDGVCLCGDPDYNGTSRGKHPTIKGWTTGAASSDPGFVHRHLANHPERNLGMFVDDGRLVIDLDGPEKIAWWKATLAEHDPVRTWITKTGNGYHQHFTVPKGTMVRESIGPGIEVKGKGSKEGRRQVVLPPSTHYSGTLYTWAVGPEQLSSGPAPAPAWLLELVRAPAASPNGEKPKHDNYKATYGSGERHAQIVHLAGTLNSEGVPLEAAERACLAFNRERCDPPKTEAEVLTIVRDLYKRYAGQHGQGPAQRGGPACARNTQETTGGIPRRLEVTWAKDIKTKPINWLWSRRIPYGKLTVIGGDPGVGKGLVGIEFSAHVSTGRAWPDGAACAAGRVLLLTGEDDKEDTINPRLEAAEANRDDVGVIDGISLDQGRHRRIDLAEDVQFLMDQANALGAKVIIIDPLSSYVSTKLNMWRTQDMRSILDPLAEAAAKYGIALIAVVHLNKSGGKAMYRFQDSVANIAAARFAYLVAPHPDNPALRLMACVKTNIAKEPAAMTFEIETLYHEGAQGDIGRVKWIGSSEMTADELVGEKKGPSSGSVEKACSFLATYLAEGGKPSEDIKTAARGHHIGVNALWEAKKAMQIRASKNGLEQWFWELPAHEQTP